MKDFFVSYAGSDKKWAEWIAWQLEQNGYSVIIQAWDFRPGTNFVLAMQQAAVESERTICVLSSSFMESRYTQPEWSAAFVQDPAGGKKKLLFVRIAEMTMEGMLAPIVYIDLVGKSEESARDALLEGVKLGRAKPSREVQFPGSTDRVAPFPNRTLIDSSIPPAIADYIERLIRKLERERGILSYIGLSGAAQTTNERLNPVEQDGYAAEFALMLNFQPGQTFKTVQREQLTDVRGALAQLQAFVLLGEPGAGKTTVLHKLFLDEARCYRRDPRSTALPLLAALADWRDDASVEEFIARQCGLDLGIIKMLPEANATVFLDGLNEMGGANEQKVELLREWIRDPRRAPKRLVATCRIGDYERGDKLNLGLPIVLIEQMDAAHVKKFVESYLDEKPARYLLDRITPKENSDGAQSGLAIMARNPFLLAAMIAIYQYSPERDLPRNTGALFRQLTAGLWGREQFRHTPGWVPYAEMEGSLARLAFAMIEDNTPTEVPLDYALNHVKSRSLLEVTENADLVRCRGNRFSFYHQLVQEYFAAVELNHVGLGDRVGQSNWNEVIVALSGIAEAPDAIVREVVAEVPYLAARCVASGADISENTCRVILSKLLGLAEDYLDKAAKKDQARAGHLAQNPNLSWSSTQMMEDALDNYFGYYPEGEVNRILELLENMSLSGIPKLRELIVQEISRLKRAAKQVGV